jgi:peptide/nickel transport system ATP-binding protein
MLNKVASDNGRGNAPLLEMNGLTKHFRVGGFFGKTLHALDDVDFALHGREIVAVVGESGSGKSTLARLLAMVMKPTRGEIRFQGRPLERIVSRRDTLAYRGHVPMVFQDPYSSLNPVHTIGYTLDRGLILHRPELSRAERRRPPERWKPSGYRRRASRSRNIRTK